MAGDEQNTPELTHDYSAPLPAQDLVAVRFAARFGVYMAGDVAGFPRAQAHSLVESGIARRLDAAPADEQDEEPEDHPRAKSRAKAKADAVPADDEDGAAALSAGDLAHGGALVHEG